MSGFDSELYLRLAGERMLLDAPQLGPVRAASRALQAIGAVDAATVAAVLADYRLATSARGQHDFEGDDAEPVVAATEPLPVRRVARVDAELELASCGLRLHYATLGPQDTTIRVQLRPSSAAMAQGTPPELTFGDDRGGSARAEFDFGHGDDEEEGWDGAYRTAGPLAQDTAYLEIDGHRVLLHDLAPSAEVRVEPVAPQPPAHRHLWECVTPYSHGDAPVDLEAAIDALVAAGALTADDPVLDAARAVAKAVSQGAMHMGHAPKALPEPWRSAFKQRSGRGPDGMIVVGASAPVFDGYALAVTSLISGVSDWRLEVELSPGLAHQLGPMGPRGPGIAWWAADDRGNTYLGLVGAWSTPETGCDYGDIHFFKPLDRRARTIELLPTGPTQRAVIRVPLVWA